MLRAVIHSVHEIAAEVMEVNDDWLRAKRGQAELLAQKLSGAEVSPLLPDLYAHRD